MTHDKNILSFPVAAVAEKVPQHESLPGAAAPVIDLQARRTATVGDDATCGANDQPNELSSGEVWDAMSDDRLVVHYQPQYDMRQGKTVAALGDVPAPWLIPKPYSVRMRNTPNGLPMVLMTLRTLKMTHIQMPPGRSCKRSVSASAVRSRP